jgi:hypothetical protein
MKLVRNIAALTLGVALLAGCAPRRFQASTPQAAGDWNAILSLQNEDPVSVLLRDATKLTGKFRRADLEGITIQVGDNPERSIERAAVHRVEHHIKDGRLNGLLLGAAIGFASGFFGEGLIFHVFQDNDGYPDEYSGAAGMIGLIAGTPTGFVVDHVRKRNVIVYQAP